MHTFDTQQISMYPSCCDTAQNRLSVDLLCFTVVFLALLCLFWFTDMTYFGLEIFSVSYSTVDCHFLVSFLIGIPIEFWFDRDFYLYNPFIVISITYIVELLLNQREASKKNIQNALRRVWLGVTWITEAWLYLCFIIKSIGYEMFIWFEVPSRFPNDTSKHN